MEVYEKAKTSGDFVGIDGAWPIFFRVMSALGFVLAKRHSWGHYETSWVRLIPIILITASMCWFLFTYPIKFTDVAYDGTVDFLCYLICNGSVVYTFAVGIYRRREICSLFAGLEGALKPCKICMTVISTLLFALYCGVWLYMNYWIIDWEDVSLAYWISMTFNSPLVLALVDLYIYYLIDALCQAYTKATQGVISQGAQLFQPRRSHSEALKSPSDLSHLGYFALLKVSHGYATSMRPRHESRSMSTHPFTINYQVTLYL